MSRRGLELATVLAGIVLTSGAGGAAVPALLVRTTSSAALQVLAGKITADIVSANVMALVKGAVQTMILAKIKVATALLLAAGAVATGIMALGNNAPAKARALMPANTEAPPNKPGNELPTGAYLDSATPAGAMAVQPVLSPLRPTAKTSCRRVPIKFFTYGNSHRAMRFAVSEPVSTDRCRRRHDLV